MSNYVNGIRFVTEHCCNCGIPFAMTEDFQKRRLRDRKSFYCPSGHAQRYVGKSEEQKLREKLQQTELQVAKQVSENSLLAQQKAESDRKYMRIRSRIANGVCPCCNRTFQNLMQHMKSEHPGFGKDQTLRAVRKALGLTQADLASELGWNASYVSYYERDLNTSKAFAESVDAWLLSVGGDK